MDEEFHATTSADGANVTINKTINIEGDVNVENWLSGSGTQNVYKPDKGR